MIDELKIAGDQLRAAWEKYCHVYSNVEIIYGQTKQPYLYSLPPELTQQLDIEVAFISSYEPRIREIKLAMNRARNYSSGLAPINTLPPEILTYIFHLLPTQTCKLGVLHGDLEAYRRSTYPDNLAQVCSLWRKTALSSCSLWCHIDISVCELYYDGLIDRGWLHVRRSGELPVELHVDDRYIERSHQSYYGLWELISRISEHVEALELVLGGSTFQKFHSSVFRNLLLGEHASLKKLTVQSKYTHRDISICPSYDNKIHPELAFWNLQVNLTKDELEGAFADLTVLHLGGVFPGWSSFAYHGLVDLRLLSTSYLSHIQAWELVTILKSSPGLQILHFGLEISDSAQAIKEEDRAHLQDLQVIKVIIPGTRSRESTSPKNVFRLMVPGSKPLRLSSGSYYQPDAVLSTELGRIFADSRVARFYTRGVFPPMNILLRHSAHLERVVIDSLKWGSLDGLPPTWLQIDELGSLPRLRSLHITRSNLLDSDLRLLLDCCPDATVIHSCKIGRRNNDETVELSVKELEEEFPTVKTTQCMLYPLGRPVADWDILD